ncbi:hypothetical protein D3C79_989540 [compost metagenome]
MQSIQQCFNPDRLFPGRSCFTGEHGFKGLQEPAQKKLFVRFPCFLLKYSGKVLHIAIIVLATHDSTSTFRSFSLNNWNGSRSGESSATLVT